MYPHLSYPKALRTNRQQDATASAASKMGIMEKVSGGGEQDLMGATSEVSRLTPEGPRGREGLGTPWLALETYETPENPDESYKPA